MFALRRATLDDMRLYFRWVNDQVVRSQALNTESIEWSAHESWFTTRLHSPSRLYVLEHDQTAVGQIRFDPCEMPYSELAQNNNKTALSIYRLDYSLDAASRGKGWGRVLIQMGLERLRQDVGNAVVVAEVLSENLASIRVLESTGFSQVVDAAGFDQRSLIELPANAKRYFRETLLSDNHA